MSARSTLAILTALLIILAMLLAPAADYEEVGKI
jgi:hypothetical protein